MRAFSNALFRRPLLAAALGLILGIALSPILPSHSWILLLILSGTGFVLAWRFLNARHEPAAALFLLLAASLLGMARVQPLLRAEGTPAFTRIRSATLRGRVAEDLGAREDRGRHVLLLERVSLQENLQDERPWPGQLRLSFEPGPEPVAWGPGDIIRFTGSLYPAEAPGNPGEFDYRSFLIGRGITASATSAAHEPPVLEKRGSAWDPWRLAWLAQRQMVQGLEQSGLSPAGVALTRGMVLGDKGSMSNRDMSAYVRTGLVHILSVSGLHLALALGLFLWCGRRLGMSKRGLAWLALPLAFAYAMICGMPVPCQRSLCLFALVLLAAALDLDADVLTSLALGAMLVLLLQPGALFEAGAQLSFAVSFSLLALTPAIEKKLPASWPAWLRLGLAATLAAEAASIPLVAWHFGLFCWTALVATIVTAPLMGPIIGLGLLSALFGAVWPWGAHLFSWPLEWVLRLLAACADTLGWLPHAAFSVGHPSPIWMLAWVLAILLAFVIWPRKRALLLFIPLLFWMLWPGLPWAHRHAGVDKAWFLDVGQGDSILVEFSDGKTLLVDAGPNLPDAGSWVVAPALRHLGVNRLDWAVVTHPHADHYGGMAWILDQFPVGSLAHSGEAAENPQWTGILAAAKARKIPVLDLSRDRAPEAWAGRIEKLLPRRPYMQDTRHDLHNNNVVLNVGGWMLLTGDLQSEGERRLRQEGLLKPVQLLKVGHHGSRTSSSLAFLRAIRPEYAVISAGNHNRFGHPMPVTLRHLARSHTALFRTDLQGCIQVTQGPAGLALIPWREAAPAALWQAPPRIRRAKLAPFRPS